MAWRREQLRQSIKITKKLERLPYLCREREEQLLKHLAGEPNKKEASTPVVNEIFLVEEESSQEKRWREKMGFVEAVSKSPGRMARYRSSIRDRTK